MITFSFFNYVKSIKSTYLVNLLGCLRRKRIQNAENMSLNGRVRSFKIDGDQYHLWMNENYDFRFTFFPLIQKKCSLPSKATNIILMNNFSPEFK